MDNYKSILITGVAGFIASNLIVHMVNKYPQIHFIGIDKVSYCSNVNSFKEIKRYSNFTFIKADVTDIDYVDFIFEQYKVDGVMHLAAYTHVDHSFGNSIDFTKNNVIGTHVLLETSKKYGIKLFLHMSTDECYGNTDHMCTESSILNPTNPYAASKAAAEHIVGSYFHSFKLPVIIIRSNNVYGPKQFPEKVIPKFIIRLLKGLTCDIQGSGSQKRSFVYIEDLINAIDLIFTKGKMGEIYNIGSVNEISIEDLANILINLINPIQNIKYIDDRNFNDHRYFISSEKVEILGWKEKIPFDEGLRKTINWYSENLNFWKDEQIHHLLI